MRRSPHANLTPTPCATPGSSLFQAEDWRAADLMHTVAIAHGWRSTIVNTQYEHRPTLHQSNVSAKQSSVSTSHGPIPAGREDWPDQGKTLSCYLSGYIEGSRLSFYPSRQQTLSYSRGHGQRKVTHHHNTPSRLLPLYAVRVQTSTHTNKDAFTGDQGLADRPPP